MNDQSLSAHTCLHGYRLFSSLKGTPAPGPVVRSAIGFTTTGALFFCLCLLFVLISNAEAAKLEDRIVAVVNSDLIMLSELKRDLLPEQDRLRKLYKVEDLERRLKTAQDTYPAPGHSWKRFFRNQEHLADIRVYKDLSRALEGVEASSLPSPTSPMCSSIRMTWLSGRDVRLP